MKSIISSAALLPEALNRMREDQTHHLLVMDDQQLVGIVSDRDLLFKGIPLHGEVLNPVVTVRDVMTPLTRTLTDTSSLKQAVELMADSRADALPVMKNGEVKELVTEDDLLRLVARAFHRETPLEHVKEVSKVALANPLAQNVMFLLAEMGI